MGDLFFVASKLFWAVARPESWFLAILVVAAVALLRGAQTTALVALGLAVAGFVAVAALPVGRAVLAPLERPFPVDPRPETVALVLSLGGGEDGEATAATGLPAIDDEGDRILSAILLAQRYPAARVGFAGGSGRLGGARLSEAEVARRAFAGAGIPEERMLLERGSRNTFENAANTRAALGGDAGGPVLLITSAWHMRRAAGVFCATGWRDVIAYPVDHRAAAPPRVGWQFAQNLTTLNLGVKEWIGLAVYRMTGRWVPYDIAPDGRVHCRDSHA